MNVPAVSVPWFADLDAVPLGPHCYTCRLIGGRLHRRARLYLVPFVCSPTPIYK